MRTDAYESRQVLGYQTSFSEHIDLRKLPVGWATAGFDDSRWEQAIAAEENGSVMATFYEFRNPSRPDEKLEIKGHEVDLGFKRPPRLEAFPGVPVRAVEEVPAVEVTEPEPGRYVFNLGQNFARAFDVRFQTAPFWFHLI